MDKVLLPTCVAGVLGWALLRRLEEIKSEVARQSDFSRRWADTFFDASNAFMVSIERVLTCFVFLRNASSPNDAEGLEKQHQAKALLPSMFERWYRIQRLILLAPKTGSAANREASQFVEATAELTRTKVGDVATIRQAIDSFNEAARRAHAGDAHAVQLATIVLLHTSVS